MKKDIPSDVYTTEAGESRRRAKADKEVPDPTPEEGRAAIEGSTVDDDEEE